MAIVRDVWVAINENETDEEMIVGVYDNPEAARVGCQVDAEDEGLPWHYQLAWSVVNSGTHFGEMNDERKRHNYKIKRYELEPSLKD